MTQPSLTSAQKARLRSLGQTLEAALKLGRGGVTPAVLAEFEKALGAHELVKVRFLGADREERAAWSEALAAQGRCACVGSVGHTALFFRPQPDAARRKIQIS